MEPINDQLPEYFSNEDSLISDYLNGHLSESEKIAFEKRLLEDSNFAKEVEFQKELALAVRMQERQKLKKSLKAISLKNKAAASRVFQFSIAAIVAVFIVSGVSLIIYLNSNSDLPTTNSTLSKNEEPIFNSKVNPTDNSEQKNKLEIDRLKNLEAVHEDISKETLASRIEKKTVKVLPLKVTNEESFGFGSNSSKEIIVNIHSIDQSIKNKREQNTYILSNDVLDIWIDTKQEIKLYNLQEDYLMDEGLEIKAGLYCRIGDVFYGIANGYDKQLPLIKVSSETNSYLLNQENIK
jgi:hypothetical protein